jgi:hypothetical protein
MERRTSQISNNCAKHLLPCNFLNTVESVQNCESLLKDRHASEKGALVQL